MKAILIDHHNRVQFVALSPIDVTATVDYFAPCNGCGDAVFLNSITGEDMLCPRCRAESKNLIIERGWTWEHPGYFYKNFGNRITVVAGTSEYRFDFTLCSADHDLGDGQDSYLYIADW